MANFPSTERVVIAWLRSQSTLEQWLKEQSGVWHVASRLRIDKLPFLVVQKLPGGLTGGEAPINTSLVQLDAYAGNEKDLHQGSAGNEDGPHYQPDLIAAQDIALEVYSLCHSAAPTTMVQGTLYGFENQEEPFRIAEDKLNVARYSFTTLVSSRL